MTARRKAPDSESSPASKLNVYLNLIVAAITILGGLYALSSFSSSVTTSFNTVGAKVDAVSQKVDNNAALSQQKVEALSSKVDATNALTQAKQDSLAEVVKLNQSEQVTFRASVQALFSKVFEGQQKATDAITQERVDRLTQEKRK